MYATFEEFIDHQQSPDDASPPHQPPRDAPPPPPAPSGGLGTPLSPLTRDVLISSSSSSTAPFCRMSPAAMAALTPVPAARDDLALASPRRSRRRRLRRLRRSVDNPLLDTISAIGGDSDDDDPHPIHHHAHHYAQHHAQHANSSAASCPRLHPETDLIGYAGSNSVDSGYKSACPTPDPPGDPSYPEHRLEKRGSLASLASSGSSGGSNAGSKPRIAMGTRVMSRGGGVPRSPGAGGGVTPTRRPGSDGTYYESDQLAALRQALLGSPTEAEGRTLGGPRYSPRVSPATLPLNHGASQRDIHVSRRAASPASPERRPRSASTGSRCSPGTRGTRKALPAGSPLLASTGSLPRASSPGRRPSLSPAGRDDTRPPPAWSRHSSPGMGAPAGRGRRPPSPIVGVDQDRESELALLEREIDVLLYGGRAGGAQYYDLESGREFPCPFGGVQDPHSCRPALASVRRLREELQETIISSSANEPSSVSASDSAEGVHAQPPPRPPPPPVTASRITISSSETCSDNCSRSPSANSSPHSPSSCSSFTFCSSEVAKCVLAMLEDLPAKSGMAAAEAPAAESLPSHPSSCSSPLSSMKGLKATELLGIEVFKDLKRTSSRKKQRYRTTPYPREALINESDDDDEDDDDGDDDDDDAEHGGCPSSCCSSSSSGGRGGSSCSSLSDYHLYEEILYEASADKPPSNIPRPLNPPPLPERPPLILKAALESLRAESKRETTAAKGPPKADVLKESLSSLVPPAPPPPFACCRCPCELIPRKQSKVPGGGYSSKARSEEGNSRTEPDLAIPPTPPLRTTSQLTLGTFLLCPLKPPVPPLLNTEASSVGSSSSFTQKGLPQNPAPLSTPHLQLQEQQSLLSTEVSPNLGRRSKPVLPLRKSSKYCKMASSSKRDPPLASQFFSPSTGSMKAKGRPPTRVSEFQARPHDPLLSQSSKPKQRSNLYSIFKDRHHRRFLSASLELEYNQQPEPPISEASKKRRCPPKSELCCRCLSPLLGEGRCCPLIGAAPSHDNIAKEVQTATSRLLLCGRENGVFQSLSPGDDGPEVTLPPSLIIPENPSPIRSAAESLVKGCLSSIPATSPTTTTTTVFSTTTLLATTMPSIAACDEKPKRPKPSLSVGVKRGTTSRPPRAPSGVCHLTCSLDLGQAVQPEDDYGFHALPNAV